MRVGYYVFYLRSPVREVRDGPRHAARLRCEARALLELAHAPGAGAGATPARSSSLQDASSYNLGEVIVEFCDKLSKTQPRLRWI